MTVRFVVYTNRNTDNDPIFIYLSPPNFLNRALPICSQESVDSAYILLYGGTMNVYRKILSFSSSKWTSSLAKCDVSFYLFQHFQRCLRRVTQTKYTHSYQENSSTLEQRIDHQFVETLMNPTTGDRFATKFREKRGICMEHKRNSQNLPENTRNFFKSSYLGHRNYPEFTRNSSEIQQPF